MRLFELLAISRVHVKALSSGSGKVVFDTHRNKNAFVKRFDDCEVRNIWTEVQTGDACGFTQMVTQKICVFLHGPDVDRALGQKEVE